MISNFEPKNQPSFDFPASEYVCGFVIFTNSVYYNNDVCDTNSKKKIPIPTVKHCLETAFFCQKKRVNSEKYITNVFNLKAK